MGIVNVTPDSFSDGGQFDTTAAAVAHAMALWEEGADWLDVGGESTRPGADPVSDAEEIDRVVPVIEALSGALPDAVLSVDTRKATVAREAIAVGATVVNDVSAAADPRMAPLVARAGAWFVLMHMRGEPRTMQRDTAYDDLLGEVGAFLARRAQAVVGAGVATDRVILDPGVGFGKEALDNPRLIAELPRLAGLGFPLLVGASRKRFIGDLTDEPVAARRVHGSVGAALAAWARGADMLRVHDVAATIQALRVYRACVDA